MPALQDSKTDIRRVVQEGLGEHRRKDGVLLNGGSRRESRESYSGRCKRVSDNALT